MSGEPALVFVEETGSTNADLIEALRSENPPREGDWLVARRQTAGRGRQGREWFDGSGNFMGSTVVALRKGDPSPSTIGFAAALALKDAVKAFLPQESDVALKWPNDVLLYRGKLSGILLELAACRVVVGIGVNLAKAPDIEGRKTASIAQYSVTPTVEDFGTRLAREFAVRLDNWRRGGFQSLLNDFLHGSIHRIGSSISVHDTDGSRITGTFAGLEESDGALRLRLADGSERVIRAGDVS